MPGVLLVLKKRISERRAFFATPLEAEAKSGVEAIRKATARAALNLGASPSPTSAAYAPRASSRCFSGHDVSLPSGADLLHPNEALKNMFRCEDTVDPSSLTTVEGFDASRVDALTGPELPMVGLLDLLSGEAKLAASQPLAYIEKQ